MGFFGDSLVPAGGACLRQRGTLAVKGSRRILSALAQRSECSYFYSCLVWNTAAKS
jgi:hypothetical protein